MPAVMLPFLENPLAYLAAPLQPHELLSTFGKRPLFIKGSADKFSALFSQARYDKILARIPPHDTTVISAAFPNTRNNETVILPSQATQMYRAGATVCVSGIDRHDPTLARFVGRVRTQVKYAGAVGINCYASPDGTGFGTHFDARIATTLQISGRKRWRFSREPAVVVPRSNVTLDERGQPRATNRMASVAVAAPDETDFDEALLEPGDVLSLPAGCWHQAAADGHSLALNLYFEPRGFVKSALSLLEHRLYDADPRWRDAPPIVLGETSGSGLPDAVRAHVSELLAALAREASLLSADDDAIRDGWRAAITERMGAADEPREQARTVEANDEMLVRHEVPFSLSRRGEPEGEVLDVYVGVTVISLGGDALELLRELSRRERFVAREAMAWMSGYAWEDTQAVLTELVQVGLLGWMDDDR